MSSCVVFYGGCLLCAVLILIQVGFFVAYQVTYLFSLTLLFGYAGLAFICVVAIAAVGLCVIMCKEDRDTSRLRLSTLIWVGYVLIGVVPSVIAIWVFVVDAGLDKSSFLGPNLRKGIAFICVVAIAAVRLCVIMCKEDRDTSRLRVSTLIWVGYVLFVVVPSVIAIWVFVVDAGLDKSSFLGPNSLKGIMCITPFVLLLMTNTTKDDISEQRRERLRHMSFQIAVDLFDVTDMLHAILEAQEQEIAISRNVRIGMTAIACFAYLLPSLQMEETKILEAGETQQRLFETSFR